MHVYDAIAEKGGGLGFEIASRFTKGATLVAMSPDESNSQSKMNSLFRVQTKNPGMHGVHKWLLEFKELSW